MTNNEQLVEVFNKISPLPKKEELAILSIFYPQNLNKDQHYCEIGEKVETVSFILDGVVKGYYLDENGKETIKDFRMDGEFMTNYRALLEKKPSEFAIQAVKNTKLLTMQYRDFEPLLNNSLYWQNLLRLINQQEFLRKDERVSEFLNLSLKERYLEFAKRFGKKANQIPKNQIALYLRATPQSLSRMLKVENLK